MIINFLRRYIMAEAIVIPIVAMVTTFGSIFGILYVAIMTRNKERLALIEKGLDATIFEHKPRKFIVLKWALLFIGCGVGVFLGALIASAGFQPEAAYFGMILLFGGVGLLAAHLIERKENNSR
jgi:hypothetical protein